MNANPVIQTERFIYCSEDLLKAQPKDGCATVIKIVGYYDNQDYIRGGYSRRRGRGKLTLNLPVSTICYLADLPQPWPRFLKDCNEEQIEGIASVEVRGVFIPDDEFFELRELELMLEEQFPGYGFNPVQG